MPASISFPGHHGISRKVSVAPDEAMRQADAFVAANLQTLAEALMRKRTDMEPLEDDKTPELREIFRNGGFSDTHSMADSTIVRVALEHACGKRYARTYDKA